VGGAFQRKRTDGPPRLLTTTVRLDADAVAWIEAEARRLGVSGSEVIRMQVRAGRERQRAEAAMSAVQAEHGQRIADLESRMAETETGHGERLARLERVVRFIAGRRVPRRPTHD
jgi:hypothetical protein